MCDAGRELADGSETVGMPQLLLKTLAFLLGLPAREDRRHLARHGVDEPPLVAQERSLVQRGVPLTRPSVTLSHWERVGVRVRRMVSRTEMSACSRCNPALRPRVA